MNKFICVFIFFLGAVLLVEYKRGSLLAGPDDVARRDQHGIAATAGTGGRRSRQKEFDGIGGQRQRRRTGTSALSTAQQPVRRVLRRGAVRRRRRRNTTPGVAETRRAFARRSSTGSTCAGVCGREAAELRLGSGSSGGKRSRERTGGSEAENERWKIQHVRSAADEVAVLSVADEPAAQAHHQRRRMEVSLYETPPLNDFHSANFW